MNNKIFIGVIFGVALIISGCSKDSPLYPDPAQSKDGSGLNNAKKATQGAVQVSGMGTFGSPEQCHDPGGEGSAYAISMTGDLEGCLYTFIEEYECSPSGTYREWGHEYFVGTYNGESGTFETGYHFEGKYEGCADDGTYFGAEIKGRCQHPVVEGSGTGVFEGVTGRIDFKDDIAAGNFPFRGHLNNLD